MEHDSEKVLFSQRLLNFVAHIISFWLEVLWTIQSLIPQQSIFSSGELKSLAGTAGDLRKPVLLNDIIDKMPRGDGLHSANVLPGNRGEKKMAARVEHPPTGRYMEVHTTEPVVINYSGYYLDVLLKDKKCKDGVVYQRSGGLLFMPQGYPDAVNHSNFPSCILRPGETYHTTTWYKFGVKT